jgi:urease accessory protein
MAREGTLRTDREPPDATRLLLVWLSPAFPIGAYAYSHGLEAAVARGLVNSRDDLSDWIGALLMQGSIRTDVILLAASWRCDRPDAELNALALALQPSAERYLETSQQGKSFVAAITAAWPCAAIAALRAAAEGDIAYAVAVGVAARGHGLPLRETAHAFALAFVQNLVSAAIRLSVIGQTDGQRLLAARMPAVDHLAASAAITTLDDLASSCFSSDLASLEHETLYTRLFRS